MSDPLRRERIVGDDIIRQEDDHAAAQAVFHPFWAARKTELPAQKLAPKGCPGRKMLRMSGITFHTRPALTAS